MRVLVLTPYRYGTAPGPRSSIELWERVLAPAGITFAYAPFETERLHEILYQPGHTIPKATEMIRAYGQRLRALQRLDDFDAVLVYREAALIGPALLERLVARRKPIIYQLDDPLYVPYRSPSNGYLSYLKVFGKVGTICRLSRVVVVNSRQHEEYASRYSDNVRVIPSLVDGEKFRVKPRWHAPGDPVCVGWSGSSSTVGNLGEIAGVLRELGERDDVRLHFIGAEGLDLPGVRHTVQPWSAATEVEDLRQIDVGLLPLPTDGWTRRKFYMKLVQYMALGIPAVCTPLGANPDVVLEGETGFLAADDAAWREHLVRLIEDVDLRERMGRRAAEVAAERYTLQANAEWIVGAVRSAMS
jgi:glycosyltransferase involved in cell wall biosynthesis